MKSYRKLKATLQRFLFFRAYKKRLNGMHLGEVGQGDQTACWVSLGLIFVSDTKQTKFKKNWRLISAGF